MLKPGKKLLAKQSFYRNLARMNDRIADVLKNQWCSVTKRSSYRGPAVYAIRLLDRGTVVSIPRFLGDDDEGLVTIGMTGNLERRRSQFVRGRTRGRGHSAANLLFLLSSSEPWRLRFKAPEFEITYENMPDKDAAKTHEAMLLRDYVMRFGEIPPLSSAFPDRYAHLQPGKV